MKVFIAFAICIAAVFGEKSEWSKKLEQNLPGYRRECITELKLDPRLIDNEANATIPSTRESTCYQACLDKKLGLMNEDGSYNLERMLSYAVTPEEREEVEKIYNDKMKNCSLATGNDPCKMAACTHSMPRYLWRKSE